MSKYKRRISLLLDDELFERAQKIPWGIRTSMLRIILSRVLDAGERDGEIVYGAVLGGDFSIEFRNKEAAE